MSLTVQDDVPFYKLRRLEKHDKEADVVNSSVRIPNSAPKRNILVSLLLQRYIDRCQSRIGIFCYKLVCLVFQEAIFLWSPGLMARPLTLESFLR